MIKKLDKNTDRVARHLRVRENVSGSTERPRLNVYRSLNNIYAQIIDDTKGATLASCSCLEKELKETLKSKTKTEQAEFIGETIAKRAIAKKIKKVVFDRGGYLYTGRVKALADGARKAGLEF